MPKLDLTKALRIKSASGEISRLKGPGFSWAYVWTPSELFALGEQGVWLDPSDLSTLFQDAAGTVPVTAVGQPVGRITDKSGNGNHAIQANAAARPVLQLDSNGKYYLLHDGVDDELFVDVPMEAGAWLAMASAVNSTGGNAAPLPLGGVSLSGAPGTYQMGGAAIQTNGVVYNVIRFGGAQLALASTAGAASYPKTVAYVMSAAATRSKVMSSYGPTTTSTTHGIIGSYSHSAWTAVTGPSGLWPHRFYGMAYGIDLSGELSEENAVNVLNYYKTAGGIP